MIGLTGQALLLTRHGAAFGSLLLPLIAAALWIRAEGRHSVQMVGSSASRGLLAVIAAGGLVGCSVLLLSVVLDTPLLAGLPSVIALMSLAVLADTGIRATQRNQFFARLVAALAQSPDQGLIVLDRTGAATLVNHAARSILRRTEGEIVDRHLPAVVHEDRLPSLSPYPVIHTVQEKQAVRSGETTLTTQDGASVQVAYTAHQLAEREGGETVLTLRDVTEERRTIETLRWSEELYRTLVESSPDGVIVTDVHGFITMANAQAARLYGFTVPREMQGVRVAELVAPEDRMRQARSIRQVLEGTRVEAAEYSGTRRDGDTFPVEIRTWRIGGTERKADTIVHVCTDISERRRAEESLQLGESWAAAQHAASIGLAQAGTVGDASSQVLRAVCDTAGWDIGAMWLVDQASTTLQCSAVWVKPGVEGAGWELVSNQPVLGRGDDLPGRVWGSGAAIWLPDIKQDSTCQRALMASRAHLHTTLAVPIQAEGAVRGIMEFFSQDIREENEEVTQAIASIGRQLGAFIQRKEAEQALAYQARHDLLTGLPNRLLLQERIGRALAVAHGERTSCAVLLMDLDRFKEVNDGLGHEYGDLLLQQVSGRVQTALREKDTPARLGGDEFAILLPATDRTGAEQVARRVLDSIEEPYTLKGRHVTVGGSIGVALYPEHGEDALALLQHADVAMYLAKRARIGYAVYAAEDDTSSPERLTLMTDLHEAIAQKRLAVHYQPKLNLKTGRIESVEALARWHHAARGSISPDQFIPLAEQSGMIKPLGHLILDTALGQCKQWEQAGLDLPVAVNLSAENLHDPELVELVSRLLSVHDLPPSSLILELTESTIMVDSARAKETLSALHDLGVCIALDDFGTGYSSLAHLAQLPVDEIKIDKSFIMDLHDREYSAIIARAVIDLGHHLGLQVVAEGVESEVTQNLLVAMDCDLVQGYHLSRPLPAYQLWEELKQHQVSPGRSTKLRLVRTEKTGA